MTNSLGSEIKSIEITCERGIEDEEMIKIHDFIKEVLGKDYIQSKSRVGKYE